MIIPYQYRYRGPYEYDKHILNTFQLHNAVAITIKQIDNDKKTGLLAEAQTRIDNATARNQELLLVRLCLE